MRGRLSGLGLLAGLLLGCGPVVEVSAEDAGESSSAAPAGAGSPGTGGVSTTAPDPSPPPSVPDPPLPDPMATGTTTGSTGIEEPSSSGTDTGSSSGGSTGWGSESSGGGQTDPLGPAAIPDDDGDVTLPSADLLGAAVYTDGEFADFRLQFAAPPFTDQATYNVTWCLDYGPGGSGSCGTHATGIDTYLTLFQEGPAGQFISTSPAVDPCEDVLFDAGTNSLRVLAPLNMLPVTADFTWIVNVTFGGSSGNNEWIPEVGNLPVTTVDVFPPFIGTPAC